MTSKEAIEAIKSNWPDERYTILRKALDMAIDTLEMKSCKMYAGNDGICAGVRCEGSKCTYYGLKE